MKDVLFLIASILLLLDALHRETQGLGYTFNRVCIRLLIFLIGVFAYKLLC